MNMSGVYVDEGLENSIKGGKVVDLAALDGTNCYCDPESADAIRAAIADAPLETIHWIDSGDYHYNSRFWMEKVEGPFALLLFDHHPDMQEPAFEALSCGGWVRDAFTSMDNMKQVLMVGINPDLELEILDLMFDGILAVTEEDLCHTGDSVSNDVMEMVSLLEPRIPVYVSIDKDVLTEEYARTDWDQGSMTIKQLESVLKEVAAGHKIIGVDICGELTREKGATDADLELNLKTNLALEAMVKSLG